MKDSEKGGERSKKVYAPPTIKVMDEEEVLSKFQLTSAMMAWWVPGGTPVG